QMIDLQHRIFLRTRDGRLHHATLPAHTATVLDIGCGTGQWACSFADAHPDITVVGADLRPPTPGPGNPANCAFVRCDAEREWGEVDRVLGGRRFDYIHARLLTLSAEGWVRFFKQCAARLAPEGVVEVTNACLPRGSKAGFTAKTSAFVRYQQLLLEASMRSGDDWETSRLHTPRIREAGLVLEEQAFLEWPVGPWAKTERERAIG
ncbi:S-adenosyl-L-methionine-dependent methyltransferase, partial [Saccharata proteae CBS 121410]